MTFQSLEFPPPETDADFESLCLAVFRDHLAAQELQKFARRGQRQLGVDLLGQDGKGNLCGIQCKQRAAHRPLTRREIEKEVDKARQFTPPLDKYFIATTARRNPAIQALAEEVTQAHAARHLFSVHVYAWDDIKELLKQNSSVVRLFYGFGRTPPRIAAEGALQLKPPSRRLAIYRLVTLANGNVFREGTAWLSAENQVVTAFHVVGDPSSGEWLWDSDDTFSYWLDLGGSARCRLSPLRKDRDADLAVMKAIGSQLAGSPLRVTQREFVHTGGIWRAEGFPSAHEFRRQSFVLQGIVAHYAPSRLHRQIQLHIQQGTHISWEGMPGAPVIIDDEVVGALTDVLPSTATFWASSISQHHPILARPTGIIVTGGGGRLPKKQTIRGTSRQPPLAAISQLRIGEFDYQLALLNTGDDGFRKNAVQDLCTAAELGFLPNENQRAELTRALEPLWQYSSYNTRNWLVKLVGLSKLAAFEGHLRRLFFDDQEDEESKSWALAAYSKLGGSDFAIDLMRSSDYIEASYRMAIQFYSDRDLRLLGSREVERSIEDNEIAAKWLTFFYGYGRQAAPSLASEHASGIVGALMGHHNDSVAEHALWALLRAKSDKNLHASFSLETLLSRPPNVRRRAYLLACKSEALYAESAERLRSRIHSESDVYAREGLALGLAPTSRFAEDLVEEIAEWYETEAEDLVRLALLPHITTFCGRRPEYELIVRNVLGNYAPEALTRQRVQSIARSLPSTHASRNLITRCLAAANGHHTMFMK